MLLCIMYIGGASVHAFMHEPHIIYFMSCSLDIMKMCVRTSWPTAGMLVHKFNYRLIEITQPYFKGS